MANTKRFEYDDIDPDVFFEILEDIGMSEKAFTRINKVDPSNFRKWRSGKVKIPGWAYIQAKMFQNCLGAIPEARKAVADLIRIDNYNPELGEYPFLKEDYND
jgi:hypothetical protein